MYRHKASITAADEDRIEKLLQARIDALEQKLQAQGSQVLRLENLGLLASAHKRHAELVFHSRRPGSAEQSRSILARAGAWYLRAHDESLSHHWTGTQHLAITAATSGVIPIEPT